MTTQTPTQKKVLPGMLCAGQEFFRTPDGLKLITGGNVLNFTDMPVAVFQLLKETLAIDHAAKEILEQWHPHSKMEQLEKYATCRFGGLDYTADICNENGIQPAEYWDCPKRGACAGEGIVCKAIKYNGKYLLPIEIKLLKQLTTTQTNDSIADELEIPLGSFHKLKKELYAKLGIMTKQEAVPITYSLNII